MDYNRQNGIGLTIPRKVVVVGCGGVGSWVGLFSALTGVSKLVLVDYDTVEEHNLNRTPFKTSQIGVMKATAIKELIKERRPECKVTTITEPIENLTEQQQSEVSLGLLVDCRDDSSELPDLSCEDLRVKGGYDGRNLTIHFNPNEDDVWGDAGPTTYTVSSYVVPPVLIAALMVEKMVVGEDVIDKEGLFSGTTEQFLEKIFRSD